MNSVQEARDRQRGIAQSSLVPDVEAAWYSMLWSMMILGDGHNAASAVQRRKQCLPYLIEHHQSHFPEDLGLIEKVVLPMFEGEREHHIIMHLITTARKADDNKKAPSPRDGLTSHVKYKIGQQFEHQRYGYKGFIIGWDMQCTAEDRWIHQMRVDDLPKGRQQPFYNVVAEDKSVRYVAQENIVALPEMPTRELTELAGRYFKRWDNEEKTFVSNIREEYPHD